MKSITKEQLAKYSDQYIAISENNSEILASGKTLKELLLKLEKMKLKGIFIRYVGPINAALSLLCR